MPPRAYHSPRRQAAARATREAVLDAALRSFRDLGYGGATIAGIAQAVGVSSAAVHATVGGKPRLVLALVERSTRLPQITATLDEARELQDPVQAVHRLISGVRAVQDVIGDVVRVMEEAARSEPLVADLTARTETMTRENFAVFVDHLHSLDALRSSDAPLGDQHRHAVDVLWYYLGYPSWEVFARMGWDHDRAEAFLRENVTRAVLRLS